MKDADCMVSNMAAPSFISTKISDKGLVIDVGANNGKDYSLAAAQAGFRVYAFEPIPDTAKQFIQTMKRNGFGDRLTVIYVTPGHTAIVPPYRAKQIVLFVAAAGASTQSLEIEVDEISETTSLTPGNGMGGVRKKLQIAVITLNDVIRSNEKVFLLKIDTQGNEPAVLQGATTIRPTLLTFEFWPKGMRRGGFKPDTFLMELWVKKWQCFDWSMNQHISNKRPSDINGFVHSFDIRRGGLKCHDDACFNFGLWDELICINRNA